MLFANATFMPFSTHSLISTLRGWLIHYVAGTLLMTSAVLTLWNCPFPWFKQKELWQHLFYVYVYFMQMKNYIEMKNWEPHWNEEQKTYDIYALQYTQSDLNMVWLIHCVAGRLGHSFWRLMYWLSETPNILVVVTLRVHWSKQKRLWHPAFPLRCVVPFLQIKKYTTFMPFSTHSLISTPCVWLIHCVRGLGHSFLHSTTNQP